MTDDETILTQAMDYVEQTRGIATTIRDEIEAGDRDPDDE
jgi:hypothetical protein